MDFARLDYRFDILNPNWKGFLYENGFVVISNVVAGDSAAKYVQRLWLDIEELSDGKVNQCDMKSRTKASNYPFMMHGGMIQYLGHSQLQWDIREICAPVFANLYNVKPDELSSSFDGLCFMDGVRQYRARSDIDFIHVDQSPNRKEFGSIQGFLNLVDNGPLDGGFVCVPGSQSYPEFFNDKNITHTDDWYLFSAEDKTSDPMFEQSMKICCAAGDFVLWDSRTWHCNTVPKSQTLRACVYVCMLPKTCVSARSKLKRAKAVIEGRVSSHHPDRVVIFPKKPRWCNDKTYDLVIKIQQRTILTKAQKILADIVGH
jgi:hypothetical protein